MILFLALTLCLPSSVGATQHESGFRTAQVRLSGPLEEVTFRQGEEDVARWVGGLGVGEERELTLPFPDGSSSSPPKPIVKGSGSATLGAWDEDRETTAIASQLSRRTRAPISEGTARAPLTSLLLLIAAGLLALSLRRRPFAAVAIGAVLGLAAGALALRDRPAALGAVRVIEGIAEAGGPGPWLRVDTGFGSLECGARLPDRLEVFPPGARTVWTARLGEDGRVRYSLAGRGARLSSLRLLDLKGSAIERGGNDWAELSATWTRGASGGWSAHGAWKLGTALPEVEHSGGAPPGWLASGLPQGIPILIGLRANPGRAESGESTLGSGAGPVTWLRLTGF